MRNTAETLSRNLAALALAVILVLLFLSLQARSKDFADVTGARNLEATHHALLTIQALDSSPVAHHRLLPTVSLGGAADKHIAWGATVPTDTGDYIYTSFTPAGFLAPYLVLGALGVPASVQSLALFGVACGAATTLLLFVLLHRMLRQGGHTPWVCAGGALLGALVSIFSREALQSHGLVYWVHSLYQAVLVLNLLALQRYLAAAHAGAPRRAAAVSLVLLVFLGAWTEWTGYVFGAGLAALCWFGVLMERPHRRLAALLVLALVAAGLVTLVHYGAVLGLEPTMDAFIRRFFARGASRGSLAALFDGYSLSFGLFLAATGVALAVLLVAMARGARAPGVLAPSQRDVALLLLAAGIPLLENGVLLQHASEFSFDRLKFIFLAALLIAFAFSRLARAARWLLALALLCASVQGWSAYRSDLARYADWAAVDADNKALVAAIRQQVDLGCAVLLSPGVRGYSNTLLGRGIHENKRPGDALALLREKDACAAIYLDAEWAHQDLPRYRSATITWPDGQVASLSVPVDDGD